MRETQQLLPHSLLGCLSHCIVHLLRVTLGASEVAQLLEGLAAKSNDLSLIPETHKAAGED